MQSTLMCYEKLNTQKDCYTYRMQAETYIEQCIPNQIKTKCPIKKIIRLVNQLLKLNLFESALFCWLLKKTHPTIESRTLSFQQADLSQIKVLNETFEKRVFLFLILNGYYVKTNFMANGSEIDIDAQILQNINNFREIYRNWKPEKSIKNINLMEINKIYESWNPNQSNSLVKNKLDYNKIVDKILFLSKTYNVSGGDEAASVKDIHTLKEHKKQLPNKKRKLNEKSQQEITIRYCEEKDIPIQHSPMKNSATNKIAWFEDDKNVDLNPLRRSTRGMNRSIFEIRQDRQDLNQNESLFRSFRSQDSDNMLNTLRNTTNNRFFNMNNSFFQLNNHSLAFGNIFKSSLESDYIPMPENQGLNTSQRNLRTSQHLNIRTSEHQNLRTSETRAIKNPQVRKDDGKVKLKPTTSHDDMMK